MFIEGHGFVDFFDQADVRQCSAHPDSHFVTEIAPELRTTQLATCFREDNLDVGIFGHALNQAVRFGQARSATEDELHEIKLQRKHCTQCIRQVLVLFKKTSSYSAKIGFGNQRLNEVGTLFGKNPHARSYSTSLPLKPNLR